MKKNLFKLLTMLMALCLILCACGSASNEGEEKELTPEEMIVGTWKGTVDCGDFLTDSFMEGLGDEEVGSYFDFSGIGFDLVLTFEEDGTFTLEVDEASAEKLGEDVVDVITNGFHDYIEDLLASELGGQSLDDYLADKGVSFEDLMVSMGLDVDGLAETLSSSFTDMGSEGEYSLEDGKLDLDGDISEIKLSEKSLTIYAPEGAEDNEVFDVLFPLVLTKSK